MDEQRGIIIADRNTDYRNEMADYFRKEGYRVETTESAVHVLCSILERHTPVVLLGSDFDSRVSTLDLIHLLKQCNRHLEIIMVSDELPLPLLRNIRHEGIFFHALKDEIPGDSEELGLAVRCAFEKQHADNQSQAAEMPITTEECATREETAARQPTTWQTSLNRILEGGHQLTGLIVGLLTLACSALFFGIVFSLKMDLAGSPAVWLFLGFCALIIVGQLLPIFRTRIASRRFAAMQRAAVSGKSSDPGNSGKFNHS